jgi:polyvinyl alcohol dehydrogenase (cytochrome)
MAAAAAAGIIGTGSGISAAAGPAQAAGPGTWTVYHHDLAGTGVVTAAASVDTSKPAWTSAALDGQLYGEPLVWSGKIYAATENNTVYALSPATGQVVWSRHLSRPVPATSLPCGNIQPTVGITGTPVIDPARGEIFVVADELSGSKPAHVLYGLAAASGRVEMAQNVDPPGADTAAMLQRTGLTLAAGQVVFGFGGNFGDCSVYRGRVAAVPEKGGAPKFFTVDAAPGQTQGAVWMGGAAPAVDSSGHIWVTTGNGSVHSDGQAYDNSDSVLELSSSLRRVQFFAPRSWAADNASDFDMSTEPTLLPDGQVIFAGKSRIVYLLDRSHLGGIGGPHAELGGACGQDIDGGSAVTGTTVFLPCVSGIIAVRAAQSPASVRRLWTSSSGGGPPIVAAGRVWTIGPSGVLYGLDPGTGQVRQQASIGGLANHFPTPSVGAGLLLAPSASHVVAFAAVTGARTAAPPASPATSPASRPTSQSRPADSGGLPAGAIAGLTVAGAAVLAGIGWLAWRRRPSRPRSR